MVLAEKLVGRPMKDECQLRWLSLDTIIFGVFDKRLGTQYTIARRRGRWQVKLLVLLEFGLV